MRGLQSTQAKWIYRSRRYASNTIEHLLKHKNNSWLNFLICDPQHEQFRPNTEAREVLSGHYVPVRPTPLPDASLLAVTSDLLSELDLSADDCLGDPHFLNFFSGNLEWIDAVDSNFITWATPYACSVYGNDVENCPFNTGNGYGDGRAISLVELLLPSGKRWELQLKGAGPTPFCRGFDGRAVLRSSVREFLASEAMHHLGIPTTRALSLVVSQSDTVTRAWYNSSMPVAGRRPNVIVEEKTAITCRASPSFLRVGHVQLFQRRVDRCRTKEKLPERLNELFLIVKHAFFREYPELMVNHSSSDDDANWRIFDQGLPHERTVVSAYWQSKILELLKSVTVRYSELMGHWIRVGYCQGNFNSDNCLVGGRTMDYGPFGFMEAFAPMWNMWVGAGQYYGFMNQPDACHKNLEHFAIALLPLLDPEGQDAAKIWITDSLEIFRFHQFDMWRQKLGFLKWNEECYNVLLTVLELKASTIVDYTIFWRELAHLANFLVKDNSRENAEKWFRERLLKSVYPDEVIKPTEGKLKERWIDWLVRWSSVLQSQGADSVDVSAQMKAYSPKYIPREWMLVDAYEAVNRGDNSILFELQSLFRTPYDEHLEVEEKYYRRSPVYTNVGLGTGGVSFMT